jgi:hypothetical protein
MKNYPHLIYIIYRRVVEGQQQLVPDVPADLFCMSASDDVSRLAGLASPHSVAIVFDIYKNKKNEQQWNRLIASDKARVSFDLYHLGIVFLDPAFLKHHYLLNF